MSETYTIRLNLEGNAVQQLEQIEKSLGRVSSIRSGVGVGGRGGRYSPREQFTRQWYQRSRSFGALGTELNFKKFSDRFNNTFKAFDKLSNEFARNTVSIFGWRRNFVNFGTALNSFAGSLSAISPVFGAATAGLRGFAAGIAAPAAVGALVYGGGLKLLRGEGIGQAASDVLQFSAAEKGLGSQYLQALQDANKIAAQYGIPRASAVSNLNILSGFSTDTGDISYQQATNLTKAAALISSFSSRPFDLVALNLQQILGVSSPNQRDIRELLHQAPILSKYALQAYREEGVIGGDPREYYKDRDALLTQLDRLITEFQIPRVSEIRGGTELRKRDFNLFLESALGPFFESIGRTQGQVYDILEDRIRKFISQGGLERLDELLSAFTNSIRVLTEYLPGAVNALTELVNALAILPDTINGIWKFITGRTGQAFYLIGGGRARERAFDEYSANFGRQYIVPTITETALSDILGRIRIERPEFEDVFNNPERLQSIISQATGIGEGLVSQGQNWTSVVRGIVRDFGEGSFINWLNNPARTLEEAPGISNILPTPAFYEFFDRVLGLFEEEGGSLRTGGGVGADLRDIEDLTKGSKSLYINFNAPLASISNTFTTGSNPQDIIDLLDDQIADIASREAFRAINNATRML